MLPTKAEFKATIKRLNTAEQNKIEKAVTKTLEKCATMMRSGLMVSKTGVLNIAIGSDPRVHSRLLAEFKKAGYLASLETSTYECLAGGNNPRKSRNSIERKKTILTVKLDD